MGFEHGNRKWLRSEKVSDTQAYRQFGNAVVVPVVEAIARFMEPCLMEMLEIDRSEKTVPRKRRAVG